jgi:hypothetical protein
MTPTPLLSYQCQDRLCCPWRPANPELVPGLFTIVESELATALCRKRIEIHCLQTPRNQ